MPDGWTRDYTFHLFEEARAGRISRRDLLRRAGVIGLSASATSTLLAACGGGAKSAGTTGTSPGGPVKRGGTLRLGYIEPSSDIDPVTAFNSSSYNIAQLCLEYLCFQRDDYTLEPRLASHWKAVKPDQWVFRLRKGVQWQSGRPVTADDVVYTMNLLTDPKSESSALSVFKGVLSKGNVEKRDANTVVFHLDRPFVDFPYLVSGFNYNAAILPQGYEIGQFIKGGIADGPFTLKQYFPKQGATLVRNPNYWDKKLPYLDTVEFKYYGTPDAIGLALQSGEIDVDPYMSYQGSQALLKDPNLTIQTSSSSAYRTLQMRVDQSPFDNKLVRQAVALCLDRPGLVQGLFAGKAQVANDHPFAPIFPISKSIIAGIPQRKQDYAAARRLLSQAGHPNGFDATLTTEDYLEIGNYAVFVKQQLGKVGIRLSLKIESQSQFYGGGANQPWLEVPLGITDWGGRGTASQTIDPAFTCGAIWNSAHWCDQRYTDLVRSFDGELDEQRRTKFGLQAARIQHDEVPDVIAYWVDNLRGARKNVHGLPPGPAQHLNVRDVWLS